MHTFILIPPSHQQIRISSRENKRGSEELKDSLIWKAKTNNGDSNMNKITTAINSGTLPLQSLDFLISRHEQS